MSTICRRACRPSGVGAIGQVALVLTEDQANLGAALRGLAGERFDAGAKQLCASDEHVQRGEAVKTAEEWRDGRVIRSESACVDTTRRSNELCRQDDVRLLEVSDWVFERHVEAGRQQHGTWRDLPARIE